MSQVNPDIHDPYFVQGQIAALIESIALIADQTSKDDFNKELLAGYIASIRVAPHIPVPVRPTGGDMFANGAKDVLDRISGEIRRLTR